MASKYGIDWDEFEYPEKNGFYMIKRRVLPGYLKMYCGCELELNWHVPCAQQEPTHCIVCRLDPDRLCGLNHRDEGAAILADLMRHVEEQANGQE